MREESQLEDMRSALRGDFERLAERRGDRELMRVPDEDVSELEVEAAAAPVSDDEPKRSWFARFVSS